MSLLLLLLLLVVVVLMVMVVFVFALCGDLPRVHPSTANFSFFQHILITRTSRWCSHRDTRVEGCGAVTVRGGRGCRLCGGVNEVNKRESVGRMCEEVKRDKETERGREG